MNQQTNQLNKSSPLACSVSSLPGALPPNGNWRTSSLRPPRAAWASANDWWTHYSQRPLNHRVNRCFLRCANRISLPEGFMKSWNSTKLAAGSPTTTILSKMQSCTAEPFNQQVSHTETAPLLGIALNITAVLT